MPFQNVIFMAMVMIYFVIPEVGGITPTLNGDWLKTRVPIMTFREGDPQNTKFGEGMVRLSYVMLIKVR